MEWWRKFQQGGGLPGMFGGGEFQSAMPHDLGPRSPVDSGPQGTYGWKPPTEDELDFRKEFAQSMFGGKKPSGQDSVGRLAIGGGMRRFEANPFATTPEISQYAPTPGFSLVRPLKKKHWYDYGGTA